MLRFNLHFTYTNTKWIFQSVSSGFLHSEKRKKNVSFSSISTDTMSRYTFPYHFSILIACHLAHMEHFDWQNNKNATNINSHILEMVATVSDKYRRWVINTINAKIISNFHRTYCLSIFYFAIIVVTFFLTSSRSLSLSVLVYPTSTLVYLT